jgi:hypothetical protein
MRIAPDEEKNVQSESTGGCWGSVGYGLAYFLGGVIGLALGITAVGCVLALGFAVLACVLPFLPCRIYRHIHNENSDLEQAGEKPTLFEYTNKGLCYDSFVRLPVNLFNFCRKWCCPCFTRDFIGKAVSIFTCGVMLGVTYYATYWICMLMVFIFNWLVRDYKFAPGEGYFLVTEMSLFLYLALLVTTALVYYVWSREISRLFTRIENATLPEYSGEKEFNRLGVTMKFLDEFIDSHGGESFFYGKSTTEVSDNLISRLTAESGLAYCTLKKNEGSKEVRDATIFVSHAWRYKFLDLISALKYKLGDEAKTEVLWIDLFSNFQRVPFIETASAKLKKCEEKTEEQRLKDMEEFQWWCGNFRHAIVDIGKTIAVFQPWNDPIPLTRAWCLWEIFITQYSNKFTGKVQFQIAMSRNEEMEFLEKIAADPEYFLSMLSNIDVAKSEATKAEDKDRIFGVINQSIGFQGVNEAVLSYVREYYLDLLQRAVHDTKRHNYGLRLRLIRGLCIIFRELGNFRLALHYSHMFLGETKTMEDSEKYNNYEAYLLYGSVCVAFHHLQTGYKLLESLRNHLHSFAQFDFKAGLILWKTQHLIAVIQSRLGNHETGKGMLTDCVEKFAKLDTNDPVRFNVKADLALICHEQSGNEVDLLFLCEEALTELSQNHISDTHPYALKVRFIQGMISKDLPLIQEVNKSLREKYGLLHPQTIACMNFYSSLAHPYDSRINALECYQAACQVYKDFPGHPDLIRAKHYVKLYSKNVYRFFVVLILALGFYVLQCLYAYRILTNQHGNVKKDMILYGFFTGLCYIAYFFSVLSPKSNEDERSPIFFGFVPKIFHTLSPTIGFTFLAAMIGPAVIAIHLFLVDTKNIGYDVGGIFAGTFALILLIVLLAICFAFEESAWFAKYENKLQQATSDLHNKQLSPLPPLFPESLAVPACGDDDDGSIIRAGFESLVKIFDVDEESVPPKEDERIRVVAAVQYKTIVCESPIEDEAENIELISSCIEGNPTFVEDV